MRKEIPMPEQKRALGYLCPECKKIVLGERTAFALMASAAAVVCGCGRSEQIGRAHV